MTEAEFLQQLRVLATDSAARDFWDDACDLPLLGAGEGWVVSTDMVVEGRHVPRGTSVSAAIPLLVRRNLSDLAASGARPRGLMLALALPRGFEADLPSILVALRAELAEFDLALLGGDTTRIDAGFVMTATIFGVVDHTRALGGLPLLARANLRMGDRLYVGGLLGRAYSSDCLHYWRPEPQLALGLALAAGVPHAAVLDVSDGVVADVGKLVAAAGLEAAVVEIHAESAAFVALPNGQNPEETSRVASGAPADLAEPWRSGLYAGGDYVLLVGLPADVTPDPRLIPLGCVRSAAKDESAGIVLRFADHVRWLEGGYDSIN